VRPASKWTKHRVERFHYNVPRAGFEAATFES